MKIPLHTKNLIAHYIIELFFYRYGEDIKLREGVCTVAVIIFTIFVLMSQQR